MGTIEPGSRALSSMRAGRKMGPVKAEQGLITYGQFEREILNEIARRLNMPLGYSHTLGRRASCRPGACNHVGLHQ